MLKKFVTLSKSARMAALMQFVTDVAALVTGIGFAVLTIWAVFASGLPIGIGFIACFCAIIVGAIIIATLERLAELYGQWHRDLTAQSIFQQISVGQMPRDFVLYLRPFASTDSVQEMDLDLVSTAIPGMVGSQFMASSRKLELENEIRRATSKIGPMVALGLPLEHVGAGRIVVSDEDWQAAISALMDYAKLIILLPSNREGTAFEVKRILTEGLLQKTMIIDPPNGVSKDLSRYDHSQEWDMIQKAFEECGYSLPPDDRKGRVYAFGSDNKPVLSHRLNVEGSGLRPFLKRVVKLAASTKPNIDKIEESIVT